MRTGTSGEGTSSAAASAKEPLRQGILSTQIPDDDPLKGRWKEGTFGHPDRNIGGNESACWYCARLVCSEYCITRFPILQHCQNFQLYSTLNISIRYHFRFSQWEPDVVEQASLLLSLVFLGLGIAALVLGLLGKEQCADQLRVRHTTVVVD